MKIKLFFTFSLILFIFYSSETLFAGEFNYYIRDHLGNTRVVLNEDGSVKEYYDYHPFGLSLRESISGANKARYKFTGKELDDENGVAWYYFGARYYDAEVGRWLMTDPLGGLRPWESAYCYVGDNPINRIDPFGLEWDIVDGEITWVWEDQIPTVEAPRYIDNSWWEGWGAEYGSPPRYGSEYSGAGEYTRQAYNVWKMYGLRGLQQWQQQNDPQIIPDAYVMSLNYSVITGGGIEGGWELVYFPGKGWVLFKQVGGGVGFSPGVSLQGGFIWNAKNPKDYKGSFYEIQYVLGPLSSSYSWYPGGADASLFGLGFGGLAGTAFIVEHYWILYDFTK